MREVALIELMVRILPPEGDVQNGTMDDALDRVTGTAVVSLRTYLQQQVNAYLEITKLRSKGFTVTVEEITE